jgi:hypothetical protein
VYQPIHLEMAFMVIYTSVVTGINLIWSIPLAARPKSSVCVRLHAGAAVSNPAQGHGFLYFVVSDRGLCDGSIPHPEQ